MVKVWEYLKTLIRKYIQTFKTIIMEYINSEKGTNNITHVDFKLDYMARLFYKIRHKKFESYVIHRMWHLLHDDRVQFVTQQYVRRSDNGKYALADLYLPQLNMFFEVNEPQHKIESNAIADTLRNETIRNVMNADLKVIDCCGPIAYVHQQIDEYVAIIKNRIEELGEDFKPWRGEDSLTVEYHQQKGYLKVSDREYVKTIDDAFAIFGAAAKHRGFLRVASADMPNADNEIIWCPNCKNANWYNQLSEDGETIIEYHKKDEEKRKEHVEYHVAHPEKRVTFFREEDDLGFNFYRFAGVFEIDKEQSLLEQKCIWRRISDMYEIQK